MKLAVNEIFASIQGEGFWTGLPCVFLRLQGCNLYPPCAWCDTKLAQHRASPDQYMDIFDVLDAINGCWPLHTIVVTGGEPMIQFESLSALIRLDDEHHKWHLETNGILGASRIFDWVTMSPKAGTSRPAEWQMYIDEIKIVVVSEIDVRWAFEIRRERALYPKLRHIWLQPVDNDPDVTAMCIQWLTSASDDDRILGLSMQVHKLIGAK